jgi:hypothetical protein
VKDKGGLQLKSINVIYLLLNRIHTQQAHVHRENRRYSRRKEVPESRHRGSGRRESARGWCQHSQHSDAESEQHGFSGADDW